MSEARDQMFVTPEDSGRALADYFLGKLERPDKKGKVSSDELLQQIRSGRVLAIGAGPAVGERVFCQEIGVSLDKLDCVEPNVETWGRDSRVQYIPMRLEEFLAKRAQERAESAPENLRAYPLVIGFGVEYIFDSWRRLSPEVQQVLLQELHNLVSENGIMFFAPELQNASIPAFLRRTGFSQMDRLGHLLQKTR